MDSPAVESEVHINEIADMGELDGGNNGAQVGARNIHDANFRALYSQNMALRREVQELKSELQLFRESEARNLSRVNNSI